MLNIILSGKNTTYDDLKRKSIIINKLVVYGDMLKNFLIWILSNLNLIFFDFIEYSSINRHSNTILILYLKNEFYLTQIYKKNKNPVFIDFL